MNALLAASGLSLSALLIVALMTFLAAAVRGLTGFGMAIILVPLLGIIIAPSQAVILAILLQLMIGPVGFRQSLAQCERPSSFIIVACAILSTPIGLWVLFQTPADIARLIIAAIAVAAFILVIIPKSPHGRPRLLVTIGAGAAAGVLTGFAAMPGPPVVPYYLQGQVSPQTARASMLVIFFATAITATICSVAMGRITLAMAALALILLIPMLVGNWLGSKAFGKVTPTIWRSCVAILLGAAGISALWRAVN